MTDPIDFIGEAVIVFGLDMIVSAWNAAAERLYGFAREETIGGRVQAAVRCRPTATLPEILAQVRLTGEWRGDIVRTRKDGSSLVVRAQWRTRSGSSGEPFDIVESSNDITELRRTEEALERAGHQYQNLFQASAASFWELDFSEVWRMAQPHLRNGPAGLGGHLQANPESVREMVRATKIMDANQQSLTMFGRGDREELMRSLDPLWPDESLPAYAESVVAAFEGRRYFSKEVLFRSLDGRHFETLFTVSFPPVVSPGARVLVGIVDVTAEKQAKAEQAASEARYRRFFDSLPISSMILEGDALVAHFQRLRSEGVVELADYIAEHPEFTDVALASVRIREVNPRSLHVFRARSVAEFQGTVARYWVDSRADFAKVLAARYRGDPSYEAEVMLRAHDGTPVHVLFFIGWAVVTGDKGLSLAAFVDVTDRVEARHQLAAVQAEFAHAARVSILGELTASIAHEVSQPLTVIATTAEAVQLWLERSPPNLEEIARLAQRTQKEAARAADIIGRIRAMAIRTEPDHAPVDLNALIEDTVLFLRAELGRSGADLILLLEPGLPTVQGDRVQLQQVIVNLGVNAIQAMAQSDTATRAITVETRRAGNRVCVRVRDTGPGIPPEVLPRLFESFFTTKGSGMGIGLAICRSIVEAHAGRISVEGSGAGAAFVIDLPVHPASLEPQHATRRGVRGSDGSRDG